MNPEINIYPTPDEVADAFARKVYELVRNAAGTFHWALSGGSTPKLLFDLLAGNYATQMPWHKIHFWWGDERCVPPDHPDSNYGMTNQHLFSKISADPGQIHRVRGELDPETACAEYIREISDNVPVQNGWPVFDLMMLGMGDDGHTASIFPDRLELLHSGQICEIAVHPQSGQKRVSLTGKALNQAAYVSFLVTGKSKSARIRQIIQQEHGSSALPAAHIRPVEGKLAFFLDREAAGELRI